MLSSALVAVLVAATGGAPQARCRSDALGSWFCAKDPLGVAVLGKLGTVLCAPGRCVEVEGEWLCASAPGGGVALTLKGPVCDGGCRAPRATDCERGSRVPPQESRAR